jgi:hypothetical protein
MKKKCEKGATVTRRNTAHDCQGRTHVDLGGQLTLPLWILKNIVIRLSFCYSHPPGYNV